MKTNMDGIFKADKKSEKEGVDFVIQNEPEISFRVRRFAKTNPKIKSAMAAYYKPYARQIELGTLDQDTSNKIERSLFIDTCLVSWKGVQIDGTEVEFTKENALKLFDALPELFEKLWEHANKFENYREDMGNF